MKDKIFDKKSIKNASAGIKITIIIIKNPVPQRRTKKTQVVSLVVRLSQYYTKQLCKDLLWLAQRLLWYCSARANILDFERISPNENDASATCTILPGRALYKKTIFYKACNTASFCVSLILLKFNQINVSIQWSITFAWHWGDITTSNRNVFVAIWIRFKVTERSFIDYLRKRIL